MGGCAGSALPEVGGGALRTTWVNEYWRRDGTHVSGHVRRLPGGAVGGISGAVLLVAVLVILAMGGHLSSGATPSTDPKGATKSTESGVSYPIKWPAWEKPANRTTEPEHAAVYPIPWTTERAW